MKNLCFILMFFCSLLTFAQQKSISGTVTTESGDPLPGVNIIVKGTSNGTMTDFNGNFTINVNQNDILVVSYIGFKEITRTIDNRIVYSFIEVAI